MLPAAPFLIALAATLVAWASIHAARAIRRVGFERIFRWQSCVLAFFVVGAMLYGGSKVHSFFTFDEYLRDDGSLVTNDTVRVAAVKRLQIIPDSTPVLVYARVRSSTNAVDWAELTPRVTYAELPHTWTLANATNYNYAVYLNYVPPSPVHTNGVWQMRGFEVPGHPDTYAFPNTKQETTP